MATSASARTLTASSTYSLQILKVDNMLFSYKMTHDRGFAPNPFHGLMTLANCKPQIRKIKFPINDKNLYIAGFTSKKLCDDKVGEERLVFIMKVSEKLTYEEYFLDPRFQCKKPNNRGSLINRAGDNIYMPDENERFGFKQLDNCNHSFKHIEHDLGGKYVLISNDFYYFGSGAITVDDLGIKIPRVQSGHGIKSENFLTLLDFLKEHSFKKNVAMYPPHSWKEGEPYN